jgi:hypothetical protein
VQKKTDTEVILSKLRVMERQLSPIVSAATGAVAVRTEEVIKEQIAKATDLISSVVNGAALVSVVVLIISQLVIALRITW